MRKAFGCFSALILAAVVARADTPTTQPIVELPPVGEELTYAVDYSGVVGAYIKVKVGAGPKKFPGTRVLTAYLATTPLVQQVWRIRDKLMSLYHPQDGRTLATRLWEDENGKRMFREEHYSTQSVSITERRSDNQKDFKVNTKKPVLDAFAALFELRRRPLKEGSVETASIYLNRKIYDCNAQISRETVTYEGQQVNTIRVDPILTYKGKQLKNVGFSFWLTDDQARTPILIEADVRYGKLSGRLLPKTASPTPG